MHQKVRCLLLALALGTIASSASATLQPIAAFTGDSTESFESFKESWYFTLDGLFGGQASATALVENNVAISYRWFSSSFVAPNSGVELMGLGHGGATIMFAQPIQAFGGYFASVSNQSDGVIEFRNGGTLLDTATLTMPLGAAMVWNGWESSIPFDELTIRSNFGSGAVGGGWFAMDDLQILVSSPTTAGAIPEPDSVLLLLSGIGALGLIVRGRSRQ